MLDPLLAFEGAAVSLGLGMLGNFVHVFKVFSNTFSMLRQELLIRNNHLQVVRRSFVVHTAAREGQESSVQSAPEQP